MSSNQWINFLIIFFITTERVSNERLLGYCPERSLIAPCTCIINHIQCSPHIWSGSNLAQLFATLSLRLKESRKHFRSFTLNDTLIVVFNENTFNGVTFDILSITHNAYLWNIHPGAFGINNHATKHLEIAYNSRLKERSLFAAVAPFVKVVELDVSHNNIRRIPDNAFGAQTRLERIDLSYNPIESIGLNAFIHLKSLKVVDLSGTHVYDIPVGVFIIIPKPTMDLVDVYLGDGRLVIIDQFGAEPKLWPLFKHLIHGFKELSTSLSAINTINNNLVKSYVQIIIQFTFFAIPII